MPKDRALMPPLLVKAVTLAILFHLSFPQQSYAYIDHGSGSYFLQLLMAGLLGLLYSIKLFWTKIRVFLAKWILPSRITKLLKW